MQCRCEWILHLKTMLGLHSFDELTVFIVCTLTQGRLNEQLRIVSEENVSLQKQLKLERLCLQSMMRSSPVTQIKGGCKCLWDTYG